MHYYDHKQRLSYTAFTRVRKYHQPFETNLSSTSKFIYLKVPISANTMEMAARLLPISTGSKTNSEAVNTAKWHPTQSCS